MEKTVKKGRNSSIELLRIVCLVMIFWMHAADSGVANGIGAWIDIAVAVIGNIGVSCFILISGYYGIRLDVKKMMHLECMLLFYSWTGLLFQYVWEMHLEERRFYPTCFRSSESVPGTSPAILRWRF